MVPITVSRAICTVCTKNANGLYTEIYGDEWLYLLLIGPLMFPDGT